MHSGVRTETQDQLLSNGSLNHYLTAMLPKDSLVSLCVVAWLQ